MAGFEEWQKNNRERFPKMAEFFDVFKKVNDEVRSDVINNAIEGALFAGTESFLLRESLHRYPFAMLFSGALAGGYAAGKHAYEGASNLFSRSNTKMYDYSLLSYTQPDGSVREEDMFYHSVVGSEKGKDGIYMREIGESPTQLTQNLIAVINNKKTFSEQAMYALENAVTTLPAKKFANSLAYELNQKKINDPKERAEYFQALEQYLEQELGLTTPQNQPLSAKQQDRLAFVAKIANKESGLKQTLTHAREVVHTKVSTVHKPSQQPLFDLQYLESMKAISTLGSVFGSPTLQKIGAVGQASYQIMSEVSKLGNLISIGALGTLMNSISVIGMAGSMVMKLFGKKGHSDNSSQVIMKQLKELSRQMAQFSEQLTQIQQTQKLIYDAVYNGFNLIYYSLKSETENLKHAVISRLEDIQSHLAYLEDLVRSSHEQLSMNPLLKKMSFIEGEYANYLKDDNVTIFKKSFRAAMNELTFWLISRGNIHAQCKSPLLTGATVLPEETKVFEQNDYKRIINLLGKSTSQLGQTLGFLIPYAQRYLLKDHAQINLLSSFGSPMNIDIWSFVVDAYKKLRLLGANSGIIYDADKSELET